MSGPKPVTKKQLREIFTNHHKHGIAELQTKGLTEEEAEAYIEEVARLGGKHKGELAVMVEANQSGNGVIGYNIKKNDVIG